MITEKLMAVFSADTKGFESGVKRVKGGLDEVERGTDKVKEKGNGFGEPFRNSAYKIGEGLDKAAVKLDNYGNKARDIGGNMMKWVTLPIAGIATAAVTTGMKFDDSMAKVQAVSGATGDELDQLRNKAKEMGANTRFSASEAAEGLNYMALAGWSTEEMLSGLDGVMNLAAASGEELGVVSDIVTDALSAFGLEAQDSARFADVLAATSSNANTDVTGLGNAFQYVAPVAGALGFTVEDTAKAIGLMSDNGIKGEKAGTALRTMMTNLSSPTKQMQEAMDELGISLTDSEGNMKSLDEVMLDMRGAFQGLDKDQQAAYASTIFGKEAMSGALAIINTSEESYNDLGEAIKNSDGAAQNMAETMGGTLGGTWREIRSGLEGFAISIYETMLPALTKVSEKILQFIQWLNDLSPRMKTLMVAFGAVAAAIGPVLVAGGTFLIWLASLARNLAPVFKLVGNKGLGGALKLLASRFSFLLGPVGIVVGIITTLATAFYTAYNRSETFRNAVNSLVNRIQSAIGFVKDFATAILNIFQGDVTGGTKLLSALGLDDATIIKIMAMIGRIKGEFTRFKIIFGNIFNQLKSLAATGLNAVVSFVQEKIAQIVGFWRSDGQQILQAAKNIFNGVRVAITTVLNIVVPIVRTALNVILSIFKTVFPLALAVVKMVWNNIKGVIDGGLKIIMGLIRVFSGIFTGDFRKMWEGVKNIFSGAIQFVWNLFQLMFYGRIIKGIAAFVRGALSSFRSFGGNVGNIFNNLWRKVVNIFTGLWRGSTRIFNNMRTSLTNIVNRINTGINNTISRLVSAVINFFRNLLSRARQIFNNMRTTLTTIVGNIRSGISTRISDLVRSVINFFRDLLSRGRQIFTDLKNAITNRISNMRENVVNGIRRMRDRALDIYRNLKNRAADFLTDMVNGAKKLPGRIGSAIRNAKQKAVNGVKSLGNSMISMLEKVVNGLIRGLNNITGKLGITATIKEWNAPRFSKGTGRHTRGGAIANDTLAVVGDKGPGNGPGTRELVQYPNGKIGLYDNDEMIYAPKGTRIFSNQETESILQGVPRFSRGTQGSPTDTGKKTGNKKGLLGTIGDVLKNTWDYVTNPGKALDAVVNSIAPDFSGLKGFAGTAVKGGFNFIKDKALDWIKGIFSSAGGLGTGKKASFMNYRMTTPYSPLMPVPGYPRAFNGGRHYGIDYGTPIGTPVHATTSGKVSKMWNLGGGMIAKLKSGKLTQFFMHLSKVLKTGQVKAGELIGRTGNTGRWTTGPHIHWQAQDGSDVLNRNTVNPLKVIKKYADGGIATYKQLAWLADGGFSESIISHDPAKASEQKAIWKATGDMLGFTEKENTETLKKILSAIIAMDEGIRDKEGNVIIDGREAGRVLHPFITEFAEFAERRGGGRRV